MGTLHGVLAELGIEAPHMHAGSAQWVTGQPFSPLEGRSYELAYGTTPHGGDDGDSRVLVKRVRIDGPGDWYDLDADAPLAAELRERAVHAFREIPS